jgi:hypothetical protein
MSVVARARLCRLNSPHDPNGSRSPRAAEVRYAQSGVPRVQMDMCNACTALFGVDWQGGELGAKMTLALGPSTSNFPLHFL